MIFEEDDIQVDVLFGMSFVIGKMLVKIREWEVDQLVAFQGGLQTVEVVVV